VYEKRTTDSACQARPASFFVEPRDPKISSGEIAAFSADSQMVALGGTHGSMQLCSVPSDCGSLEPRVNLAPPEEGQWLSWAFSPHENWITAVSEFRRVHFKNPQSLDVSFAVDLMDNPTRIPVASNRYVMTSGLGGRQVGVVFAQSESWATAFEIDRYHRNKRFSLVRLASPRGSVRIDVEEVGCSSFASLAFDPQDHIAIAFQGQLALDLPCAALVQLPASGELTAKAVAPRKLPGYSGGKVLFSAQGNYLLAGSDKGATIWARRGSYDFDPITLADGGKVRGAYIDPREAHLITSVLQDGHFRVKLQALGRLESPSKLLATAREDPTIAFDPRGEWLVVVTKAEANAKRIVNLWRLHPVIAYAAEWRIDMEDVDARIVFAPRGDKFVVGPSTFEIPRSGLPLANLPALLVDLTTQRPRELLFSVPTESYRGGSTILGASGKPAVNGAALNYRFSADSRWLATASPGNLWSHMSGRLDRTVFFGAAWPMFSPDSRLLLLADGDGSRLVQLTPEGPRVERGNVAPPGDAAFSSDSSHLLILVDGEIRRISLTSAGLIDSAANIVGRNLAWEAWREAFPSDPYAKVFPHYPVEVSYIDELIARARRLGVEGRRAEAATALSRAAEYAIETKSTSAAMAVTKVGILIGDARSILPAAEYMALVLPTSVQIRDWRGRARAAAGLFDPAIADFEYVATNVQQPKVRDLRLLWVQKLRDGKLLSLTQLGADRPEDIP
jgi:hypothetical protein